MRRLVAVLALAMAGVWSPHASAPDYGAAGPYGWGQRQVTVRRPNGTTFAAQLYYPAASSGAGAPLLLAAAPYPAVTFGHGFLQIVQRYDSTLRHLATWGYVVIASESEGGLFPNHSNFAEDLRHALSWLESENARPGSELQGAVDPTRFGASGHSMGGGASILAASRDVRLRALAPLAAANTNPSAIDAMPLVGAPVILVSGSSDSITPPDQHQAPMYAQGRAPRQLPSIQGGWHCGFQDVSVFGCDSGPMPRATQLRWVRRLLTGFFELHLRGDQRAWTEVWGPDRAGFAEVLTTSDPGIGLAPLPGMLSAPRGGRVSFVVQATNTGTTAKALELLVSGVPWRILLPGEDPVAAPGGVASWKAVASIPRFVTPGDYPLLVSVRSLNDGGARAYRSLTLRVTP